MAAMQHFLRFFLGKCCARPRVHHFQPFSGGAVRAISAPMLHINNLTYRIAGRILLDTATVHIPQGSRVGLVGRNGAGKSTLLKLIMGEIASDGGDIRLRPRASLGKLSQEAPDGDTPLIDCVLAADSERATLLAELDADPDHQMPPERMSEIHERLNAIDAHSAPARAASILSGLGFPAEHHSRGVGEYSGGWRMRVALAAVLFASPDLLLLDEPTNHLTCTLLLGWSRFCYHVTAQ